MRGIPSLQRLLNVTRPGETVDDSNLMLTCSAGPGLTRVADQPAAGEYPTILATAPSQRTVTEFPSSDAERSCHCGSGSPFWPMPGRLVNGVTGSEFGGSLGRSSPVTGGTAPPGAGAAPFGGELVVVPPGRG